jgi:NTE family protein
MRKIFVHIVFALFLVMSLNSCSSSRAWNTKIHESNAEKDYVFYNRMPKSNAQDTFVVLVFSGGGSRSSAFAYGVLEKLRDTPITIDGKSRRLLDEVDVISAVSGGSYTAAYYGLFGNRIFRDFENIFLHRDVQGEMIHMLLNPLKLAQLTSKDYNRGDLAAQWLNKNIFENKTFSHMSNGDLPYVILNASDLNTGMTFSFIQQQFDFLCSDISDYPVANAVMASSSVPGVFAPITLNNPQIECAQKTSLWNRWVKNSLNNDTIYSRRFQVARALSRYYQPLNMPKVRLVDGGVTDNLGVRGSIMSPVAHYGNALQMSGAFSPDALKKVKRVLVIVANAQTYVNYDWSKAGRDPGFFDTMDASFSAAMGILNTETITLARNSFTKWQEYTNAKRADDTPKVKVYFSTLTFDQITDAKKRDYFNAIPTAFRLTKKQVTSVSKLAGELLDKSTEFQAFKKSTVEK